MMLFIREHTHMSSAPWLLCGDFNIDAIVENQLSPSVGKKLAID